MFIDGNPVEREKARKNVPGLIVPPFTGAPEDLAAWLLDSPFLASLSLTASDLKRTAQYKIHAREVSARRQFQNIEDFHRDLGALDGAWPSPGPRAAEAQVPRGGRPRSGRSPAAQKSRKNRLGAIGR